METMLFQILNIRYLFNVQICLFIYYKTNRKEEELTIKKTGSEIFMLWRCLSD